MIIEKQQDDPRNPSLSHVRLQRCLRLAMSWWSLSSLLSVIYNWLGSRTGKRWSFGTLIGLLLVSFFLAGPSPSNKVRNSYCSDLPTLPRVVLCHAHPDLRSIGRRLVIYHSEDLQVTRTTSTPPSEGICLLTVMLINILLAQDLDLVKTLDLCIL